MNLRLKDSDNPTNVFQVLPLANGNFTSINPKSMESELKPQVSTADSTVVVFVRKFSQGGQNALHITTRNAKVVASIYHIHGASGHTVSLGTENPVCCSSGKFAV